MIQVVYKWLMKCLYTSLSISWPPWIFQSSVKSTIIRSFRQFNFKFLHPPIISLQIKAFKLILKARINFCNWPKLVVIEEEVDNIKGFSYLYDKENSFGAAKLVIGKLVLWFHKPQLLFAQCSW